MRIAVLIFVSGLVVRGALAQQGWSDAVEPAPSQQEYYVILHDPNAHGTTWIGDGIYIETSEGMVRIGTRVININEFQRATEGQGENIQSSMIAQNAQALVAHDQAVQSLNARVDKLETGLTRGIALLAALDFARPAEGKWLRVSVGTGTYDSETTAGLGMTVVHGRFDLSAGVATTGSESLGKASVGVSF